MKKNLYLLLAAALLSVTAGATVPHRIIIPDIEGYKTLKGELHIHTVFSDASVWPTTRIDEAMTEGLDFIAVTDHVDARLLKQKNRGLMDFDRNESYKIAAAAGKSRGVLVIHGGEISRGMPPGHFNTLFVSDCEAIGKASDAHDNHYDAMQAGLVEAQKQGGFLVWNHPHWERQAQNETRWYPEHTALYDAGLMQGVEIYNAFCGYSPEAHRWAMERGLALICGTDSHAPMFLNVDFAGGGLRPVTLVFARERSLGGIREALDARRTAVFADGMLYGREEVLQQLMQALFELSDVKYAEKKVTFRVANRSSIPLTLRKAPGSEKVVFPRDMIIRPFEEVTLTVYGLDNKKPIGLDRFDVNFHVLNFLIDAGKPMTYSLHFEIPKK
ncbi:Sb-PDE family phosphodiesterase [uncultured Alistipes sp.]|jgi:predicted metal-dependent phosphoesterase TrpH|uniref:Sb-PDE family phosphodiesterase n=1 Tax=uncultured Alistipes sp. TaxID=538949 RepID=UPI0025DC6531|nr:Sb-PDE family phosphodiesterase [uncultured Alistipes sp.]